MRSFENFIGIDISKDTLDIALVTKDAECISLKWENNRAKIKKAFKALFKDYDLLSECTLICAEHSGHFGNKLVDSAVELGLNIWMESPYNILHSQGLIRGKNDKVDAIRIAEYARRFVDKANLIKPTSYTIKAIKLLTTERDLLINTLKTYKGQLKQEEGFLEKEYFKSKKKRVGKIMKALEKNIKEIEEEIQSLIKEDDDLKHSYELVTSVRGVGMQTAVAVIVATENFTKFDDPRKFACHAGCAPFRYQSGTSINSRNKVSQRANKSLKKLLHMAAVSVIRTTGELRQYYDRKVAEGKHKMSVINALRSKIIHRIFAAIKNNRKYEEIYTHSLG